MKLITAMMALLLILQSTASAEWRGFENAPGYSASLPTNTYPYPYGVRTADLNQDNHQDIIIPLYHGGRVSVGLGKGDSTFGPLTEYPTTYNAVDAAVGDFNQDGALDLAVTGNNTISILIANTKGKRGDGTFQPAVNYTVPGYLHRVIAKDLNGDALLDLACVDISGDRIAILLGNGDGSFQEPDFLSAGDSPYYLVSADLNYDGATDIVCTNYSDGDLMIFIANVDADTGKADGSFASGVRYPAGDEPMAIVAADFNRDGILDIANSNGSDRKVTVFFGIGDGTLHPPVNYTIGENAQGLATADLNGDGFLDLVAPSEEGSNVAILLGTKDGAFQEAIHYGAGEEARGPSIADFNEDGALDIVVANNREQTYSMLVGKGDGTFFANRSYFTGDAPYDIASGYYNRDDSIDFAITNLSDLTLLFGNGDGSFTSVNSQIIGVEITGVASGDFNGDSITDLAVTDYATSQVIALLGNNASDGTFFDIQTYPVNKEPGSIIAHDLNADNILDLVTACHGSQTVDVLIGNGDGSFQSPLSHASGGAAYKMIGQDINADSVLDFVTINTSDGSLSIILGSSTGDGTLLAPVNYTVGADPRGVAAADFNGDGNIDLAACSFRSDATLSLLFGNGDGSFQPAVSSSHAVPNAFSIAASDFNGDAINDLAVGRYRNDVDVFLGNGDGTFRLGDYFQSGLYAFSALAQDTDEDCFPELLTVNAISDTVTVAKNLGQSLQVTPAGIDFGTVQAGSGPVSITCELHNTNKGVLKPSAILFNNGNNMFALETLPAPRVRPGGTTTFSVRFSPTTPGTYKGSLALQTDSRDEPVYVPLCAKVVR